MGTESVLQVAWHDQYVCFVSVTHSTHVQGSAYTCMSGGKSDVH